MFSLIKKLFIKKISNDERIIFEKISMSLPDELKQKFDKQVDAIVKSVPAPDAETLAYEIDMANLIKTCGSECVLTKKPGMVDFVKIDIRLFEQTQPFVLRVKDGLIHSLRLFSPIISQSDIPEFSVIKFELFPE